MAGLDTRTDAMTQDEKVLSQEIGRRVAELREKQDLTQVELARLLGISQQKVAAIEMGSRRLAITMLPAMARALGASVEELLGEEPKAAKRGPVPRLQRHMERIAQLPKARQRFVLEVLDSVLQQEGR